MPLAGRLRAELARHKLATGRTENDLCFGRPASSAFTRSTVRSRANPAWQAAGLEPLTPHQARHCAASYMAACGLTPKEAQTALGHAAIRTTMNVYAKAVPGWEQDAASEARRVPRRESFAKVQHPAGRFLSGSPAVLSRSVEPNLALHGAGSRFRIPVAVLAKTLPTAGFRR